MGIQMPLPKSVALIPHQTNPHKIISSCSSSDGYRWFPSYFLIMMPNTVATIAKSIRRSDYSTAILCSSAFLCFILLKFCLSKHRSLPENEKSSRKFMLKLNMWFLYSAISFGFVYPFADFFPPEITVGLYSVVVVFSSFLFHEFLIVDLVRYWKMWRHGKMNDYSVLTWAQV